MKAVAKEFKFISKNNYEESNFYFIFKNGKHCSIIKKILILTNFKLVSSVFHLNHGK